jgi:hypothetical protein
MDAEDVCLHDILVWEDHRWEPCLDYKKSGKNLDEALTAVVLTARRDAIEEVVDYLSGQCEDFHAASWVREHFHNAEGGNSEHS